METKFTYDNSNHRIVTGPERPGYMMPLTALVFGLSLYGYNRRIFRIDQNSMNFMIFAGASLFASYGWVNFATSTPDIEAGLMNNKKEASI